MFLVNSRQESFIETLIDHQGEAYSEVTPAVLPNSFTRNHPFALGYSPCPPVSVFGTDPAFLARKGFSWKLAHLGLPCQSKTFCLSLKNLR